MLIHAQTVVLSSSRRISVLAVCLMMFGCSTSPTVDFRLPPGFRGVVQVRADPIRGYTPREVNGVIVIPVPDDGKVVLDSIEMFIDGVNERLVAADGTILEYNEDIETPGVVRAYSLGYSLVGGERIGFYIGTPEEWKLVDRTRIGFALGSQVI